MKRSKHLEYQHLREEIISSTHQLQVSGLLSGTAGNVSARTPDGTVLITPSGLDYALLKPEDIMLVDLEGSVLTGDLVPSSEVTMHTGIYRSQPLVGGIVHTHAHYSTVLACLGWEIPPIHYMLTALAMDGRVPLVLYALYGTEELANYVAQVLDDTHHGCLLQNHGNLTVGMTVREAYSRSVILEDIAGIYYQARLAGEPRLLNAEQVAEVYTKFANYGQHKGKIR